MTHELERDVNRVGQGVGDLYRISTGRVEIR